MAMTNQIEDESMERVIEKRPADDVFPLLDIRVSRYQPELPHYVHSRVTFAAVYMLAAHDDIDRYLAEAPEGYAQFIADRFLPDEQIDDFHAGKMVDLSEAFALITNWANRSLEMLVNDIRAGALTIVTGDRPNTMELEAVIH